jgi:hypothetical protein
MPARRKCSYGVPTTTGGSRRTERLIHNHSFSFAATATEREASVASGDHFDFLTLSYFPYTSYHRLVKKKHGSTGKRQEATFRSNRKNETQGKKSPVSMLIAFEPMLVVFNFVPPHTCRTVTIKHGIQSQPLRIQ